jgi:hypothetical protein
MSTTLGPSNSNQGSIPKLGNEPRETSSRHMSSSMPMDEETHCHGQTWKCSSWRGAHVVLAARPDGIIFEFYSPMACRCCEHVSVNLEGSVSPRASVTIEIDHGLSSDVSIPKIRANLTSSNRIGESVQKVTETNPGTKFEHATLSSANVLCHTVIKRPKVIGRISRPTERCVLVNFHRVTRRTSVVISTSPW